jgi:hypothetical protein
VCSLALRSLLHARSIRHRGRRRGRVTSQPPIRASSTVGSLSCPLARDRPACSSAVDRHRSRISERSPRSTRRTAPMERLRPSAPRFADANPGATHFLLTESTGSAQSKSESLLLLLGPANQGNRLSARPVRMLGGHGVRMLPDSSRYVITNTTQANEKHWFAGLPMRPSGLEPPRGKLPTRPSTLHPPASYVRRRPDRPYCTGSGTPRTARPH